MRQLQNHTKGKTLNQSVLLILKKTRKIRVLMSICGFWLGRSQYQCSSTESISFKNDESVSTLSNPQKPDLAEEKKSRLTQAQELHLAAAAFFVIPGQIYAGEVMSNCLAFICIMIQRFPPMGVVEGAYLIVVLCSKISKYLKVPTPTCTFPFFFFFTDF